MSDMGDDISALRYRRLDSWQKKGTGSFVFVFDAKINPYQTRAALHHIFDKYRVRQDDARNKQIVE